MVLTFMATEGRCYVALLVNLISGYNTYRQVQRSPHSLPHDFHSHYILYSIYRLVFRTRADSVLCEVRVILYIKYRIIFVFKGLRSLFSYLVFPQNNKIHPMYIRNDVQNLAKTRLITQCPSLLTATL